MYNDIIKQNNFLGIPWFKRIREIESEIPFKSEPQLYSYAAYVAFALEPKLHFKRKLWVKGSFWIDLLLATFKFSFFNLIINGYINVIGYTDKVSYLGGIVHWKESGFNHQPNYDYKLSNRFEQVIMTKLNYLKSNQKNSTKLIKNIVDKYMGQGTSRSNPVRYLMRAITMDLAEANAQIEVVKDKIFMGTNYHFELTEKLRSSINMEYQSMDAVISKLYNDDPILRSYFNKLEKLIRMEMRRREPSDNGGGGFTH